MTLDQWPLRVQIGDEVYIEDPACGGALLDVPQEYEPHIRAMADTHPGQYEPCAYEDDLLLTFFIQASELPFPPCYYGVAEEYLAKPGQHWPCFEMDGDAPE